MYSNSTDQLKHAVETQHGGSATFVRSVPVHESFRGKTVWNGVVQVFDLAASPNGATRAYAWSYGLPDGNREFVAMLHVPPVTGPREAVRAVLPADQKRSG